MGYLLGIDMGHSSIKSSLVDYENGLLFFEKEDIKESYVSGLVFETDPEEYIHGIKKIVSAFKNSGIDLSEIESVSFSVAGESILFVDSDGKPLTKIIMGMDSRAAGQAQDIKNKFGDRMIYKISGQPDVDSIWPACKVRWIRENRPEVFAKTRYVMFLEDYIIYRLTGKIVCECTMASSSLYYDYESGDWWDPMLNYLEIKKRQLPPILAPAVFVGNVTKKASEDFGLSTDTKIATGIQDQIAGAIGAGNIKSGMITETTGTTVSLGIIADNWGSGKGRGIPFWPYICGGKSFLLPWSKSGGSIYQWFRNEFYGAECATAQKEGKDIYRIIDEKASRVPAGSNGLIMLPHFWGAVNPENNADAVGVIYGLNISSGKDSIGRSILEAVALVIRSNVELLKEADIPVIEIRSMGGGARSPLWCQIKADVLGLPLQTLENEETASLGAALLAGLAVKKYVHLEDAVNKFVKVSRVYVPDEENIKLYDGIYKKYREIYKHLLPVFGSK